MLHEFRQVKQERGDGTRRWFESDGFDLVVWYESAGDVSGFLVCYDFGHGEHALTWRRTGGFSHHAVDTGSNTPFSKMTPILVADGAVPWSEITRTFETRGASLEPKLRELIREALARH